MALVVSLCLNCSTGHDNTTLLHCLVTSVLSFCRSLTALWSKFQPVRWGLALIGAHSLWDWLQQVCEKIGWCKGFSRWRGSWWIYLVPPTCYDFPLSSSRIFIATAACSTLLCQIVSISLSFHFLDLDAFIFYPFSDFVFCFLLAFFVDFSSFYLVLGF